jgi:hypothetical protein
MLPTCPGPGPHDGGEDLGPLYENHHNSQFPHTYACAACFAAAGVSPDRQMLWPQNDITSENPPNL